MIHPGRVDTTTRGISPGHRLDPREVPSVVVGGRRALRYADAYVLASPEPEEGPPTVVRPVKRAGRSVAETVTADLHPGTIRCPAEPSPWDEDVGSEFLGTLRPGASPPGVGQPGPRRSTPPFETRRRAATVVADAAKASAMAAAEPAGLVGFNCPRVLYRENTELVTTPADTRPATKYPEPVSLLAAKAACNAALVRLPERDAYLESSLSDPASMLVILRFQDDSSTDSGDPRALDSYAESGFTFPPASIIPLTHDGHGNTYFQRTLDVDADPLLFCTTRKLKWSIV